MSREISRSSEEMSSAALGRERDLDLILRNRNAQLSRLAERLSVKETALQQVMDAVTLAEAKRIVREAIRFV